MDTVIEINRRSVFTVEEARELLPIVFRITKSYSQRVQVLLDRLDSVRGDRMEAATKIETQVNTLVQEWQNKLQKLGALPKGLWMADFDSGDGYFCWKFPERSVDHWHRYTDGYSKRMSIHDRPKANSLSNRLRHRLFPSTSLGFHSVTDIHE